MRLRRRGLAGCEQVQLQLVTATVKLFLKKPTEKPQAMIQLVLTYATQETDNPDLRDRACALAPLDTPAHPTPPRHPFEPCPAQQYLLLHLSLTSLACGRPLAPRSALLLRLLPESIVFSYNGGIELTLRRSPRMTRGCMVAPGSSASAPELPSLLHHVRNVIHLRTFYRDVY